MSIVFPSCNDIAELKSEGQVYHQKRLMSGRGQISSGSGSRFSGIAKGNLKKARADWTSLNTT